MAAAETVSDFDHALVGVGGALAGFTSSDDEWDEQMPQAAPQQSQQLEHAEQTVPERAERGEQHVQGRPPQAPEALQALPAAQDTRVAKVPCGDALLRPKNAQRAAVQRRQALISPAEATSLLALRDSQDSIMATADFFALLLREFL